jgi:hypothetical protein
MCTTITLKKTELQRQKFPQDKDNLTEKVSVTVWNSMDTAKKAKGVRCPKKPKLFKSHQTFKFKEKPKDVTSFILKTCS